MKHLLSAGDLSQRRGAADPRHRRGDGHRLRPIAIKKLPTLRGRTVVNLFFEDSTRTRTSFEVAAKRLSADVITFSAKGSSVSKGESLKDTALTLEAMGADGGRDPPQRERGTVEPRRLDRRRGGQRRRRHPRAPDAGAARRLHDAAARPAGSRACGSPSSATSCTQPGGRSQRAAAPHTLGAEVTLVAPPTLLPLGVGSWPAEVSYDLDAVLPKSDVAMMLRVQRERMGAAFFPTEREYSRRDTASTADRMAAAARTTRS